MSVTKEDLSQVVVGIFVVSTVAIHSTYKIAQSMRLTEKNVIKILVLSCIFISLPMAHYITQSDAKLKEHLWSRVLACSAVVYADTFQLCRNKAETLLTLL